MLFLRQKKREFLKEEEPHISLIFGGISSATAPMATVMIIREYRAKGVLTNTLLGVVAIDDAWCLIIFCISLAIAKGLVKPGIRGISLLNPISHSILEIGDAFALGLGLIPQAGVALGVALIAKIEFPEVGGIIFTTIIATTIIYEIIGPFCTKFALMKAKEI